MYHSGLQPLEVAPFLLFQAFSGFYGVVKDLNLTSTSSLDEILAATKNICSKPWSEVSCATVLRIFVSLSRTVYDKTGCIVRTIMKHCFIWIRSMFFENS